MVSVTGIIGVLSAITVGTILHKTGGSFLQGAVLGFVAGTSFGVAFFRGTLPLAIMLAFVQGIGSAAIEYLAAHALGELASSGMLWQAFFSGFAIGAASGAFGDLVPGPALAPLLSFVSDAIGSLGSGEPFDLGRAFVNAVIATVLAIFISGAVTTHFGLANRARISAAEAFVQRDPIGAMTVLETGLGAIIGVAVGLWTRFFTEKARR